VAPRGLIVIILLRRRVPLLSRIHIPVVTVSGCPEIPWLVGRCFGVVSGLAVLLAFLIKVFFSLRFVHSTHYFGSVGLASLRTIAAFGWTRSIMIPFEGVAASLRRCPELRVVIVH